MGKYVLTCSHLPLQLKRCITAWWTGSEQLSGPFKRWSIPISASEIVPGMNAAVPRSSCSKTEDSVRYLHGCPNRVSIKYYLNADILDNLSSIISP